MSKGGKQVTFKVPQSKLAPEADQWIHSRGAEPATSDREGGNVTPLKPAEAKAAPAPEPAPKEKVGRLTIDVPESLHRRFKMQCAARGLRMADVMRELIEREFPEA